MRFIEFWNAVISFGCNDPKNLNKKIIKWYKRLFFVDVRRNKYNFYFEVTIKLF